MTIKEYNEVKEYIKDHFEHFDGYPVEVETNDGTVYRFEDYLKYLED
jgi:hypothetical protein